MSLILTTFRAPVPGVLAVAVWLATASAGRAGDAIPAIRTGEHSGVWAGHMALFSVQQVHDNGTFDGVAEHTEGQWKGLKFGFHGKIAKDGSLVVTRHVAGDTQIARAGPPKAAEGRATWSAETKGIGIPDEGSWPFSLTVRPKAEADHAGIPQQGKGGILSVIEKKIQYYKGEIHKSQNEIANREGRITVIEGTIAVAAAAVTAAKARMPSNPNEIFLAETALAAARGTRNLLVKEKQDWERYKREMQAELAKWEASRL